MIGAPKEPRMPSKKKPQEPAKPAPKKDLPSDSEHEPAPSKKKGGGDGSEE